MTTEYDCIPCCDYCKYYKDNGGGPEKRGNFAGVGECLLLGWETLASSFCDEFICSVCSSEKQEEDTKDDN